MIALCSNFHYLINHVICTTETEVEKGAERICPAGEVFHVLNRAVTRLTIFEQPADYAAFMRVVGETCEIVPLPIYGMVAMPDQQHFVVRPETSDQVSEFFRRLTVMHTMRWHAHYKTGGTGHLYQGTFQIVSNPNGPRLADGHAVRRAERGSCTFHRTRRRLAMEFRVCAPPTC